MLRQFVIMAAKRMPQPKMVIAGFAGQGANTRE